MGWLKNFLKPKKDNFVRHLAEQARLDVEGLEVLRDYMKGPTVKLVERLHRVEKEADEVRRILVDELNRTFVTPFDREDIYALSRAIDDLLDYAYTTAEEMELLGVEPNQHLVAMVDLLLNAAREIHQAMQRIEEHPGVAHEHARRVKGVENAMEVQYRKAVAELFSQDVTEPKEVLEILKRREVCRHLSNAADRADEAANHISDIVVKMT